MLVPFALLIAGLTVSIAGLNPQLATNYTTSYAGSAATGNLTLLLPPVDAEYLQLNLTIGGCDVRVYPATEAEWAAFNDTGVLPPAWIGCSDRSTTTTGDVHQLILVDGGPTAQAYNVTVLAYSYETPYGWIALPGTALALAGLLILVPRVVTEKATRMRDAYGGKKEKEK